MKRSPLRKQGKSETAKAKRRIQALLRKLVMLRDGGCILRHYRPQAGECGGYRQDGELILQADHLITRSNTATYGDSRNVVCLCKRHHGYWKPQHSHLYWELVKEHIGEKRWEWFKRAEKDRKPHGMTLWDWGKVEIGLKQEIENIKNEKS